MDTAIIVMYLYLSLKTNSSELQINFSNNLLQGKYGLLKKGENPNRSELQLTLIIIYSKGNIGY